MALKKKGNELTTGAVKKEELVKRAQSNLVTSKNNVGVKNGIPIDVVEKMKNSCVGMNKGVTINMGDYETFRWDCWLGIQLKEFVDIFGEEISNVDLPTVYDMISNIIEEVLENEVQQVLKDEKEDSTEE